MGGCLPSLAQLSIWRLTRTCGQEAIGEGTSNLLQHNDMIMLPGHLKDSIRDILLKRQKMTPSDLKTLLHPNVKEIDLSEQVVTAEHLSVLSMLCGKLRKINLSQSIQCSCSTTSALQQGQPRQGQEPGGIGGCCERNENLVSLHLSLLFNKQPFLNTVYLRGVAGVTCDVVSSLAKSCPQLSSLDLGECPHVDDSAVEHLRSCRHLQSLSLARTKISDRALHSIARSDSRNNLNELRIYSCEDVTDDGIEILLENLGFLQILIFHGCPKVTERARESIEDYLRSRARAVKQLTWTVY